MSAMYRHRVGRPQPGPRRVPESPDPPDWSDWPDWPGLYAFVSREPETAPPELHAEHVQGAHRSNGGHNGDLCIGQALALGQSPGQAHGEAIPLPAARKWGSNS